MALTVRQLLEIPRLGLAVFAGESGLGREVYRAQVSELSDPWAWQDPGGLMMTTGIGIPEDPDAQRNYIERLDDHGLSGLLVGEHPEESINAPEFSDSLAHVARVRSFPVLTMPYDVPFSWITEVVSQGTSDIEHASLLKTLKIYDTVRQTMTTRGANLLVRLEKVVGCDLFLVDPSTGAPMVPGKARRDTVGSLPEPFLGFVEALRAHCDDEGRLSRSTVRLATEYGSTVALNVPSSRSVALVAITEGEREPDLTSLRHVAAVVAIEVERENADLQRRYRMGMSLVSGLAEGRVEEVAASRMLADVRVSTSDLLVAAFSVPGRRDEENLVFRLDGLGIEPLAKRFAGEMILLLDAPSLEIFLVDAEEPVGISEPLGRLSRTPEAIREALWALSRARESGVRSAKYGMDEEAPFLPRTIGESERAVRFVLGSLLDYDSENDASLTPTLRSYLASGRSLKAAAAQMNIHRQTVVYRIRRVEEITGFRLEDTDDASNLWMALKSLKILHRLGAGREDQNTD